MSIKVNTYQLQSKAVYGESLSCQLETAANQLHSLYYSLDSQIKSRRGIGSTMRNLEQRIEKSRRKMYNISKYLAKAAADYDAAEAAVGAMAAGLGAVNATGAASMGWTSVGGYAGGGAATGKMEGKKWYESNLFKIAVGAVVVGATVAVAMIAAPLAGTIAAIAIAAAKGAAIGALVGGVTSGIVSAWHGGKFMDGFANGFMWGSIVGAVSGIISGAVAVTLGAKSVVAAVGAKAAKGLVIATESILEGVTNAGLYVAQTRAEGGQITPLGLGSSFAIAAGISAVGGVISAMRNASKGRSNKKVNFEAENPMFADGWLDDFKIKYGENNVTKNFTASPDLENHITKTDTSVPVKRGIGGAHNEAEFLKNDVQIINSTPSSTVPGVKQVEYNMPKLDGSTYPAATIYGEYGTTVYKKTIYDSSVIGDGEFIKRGLEAANSAMLPDGSLPGVWSGLDRFGVEWTGYFRDGQIDSFFPSN